MFETISKLLQFQDIYHNLALTVNVKNVAQILVIIAFIVFVHYKFLKNTAGEKIIRGIMIFIFFMWGFSALLIKYDFIILGVVAQTLLAMIAFSFVVVFQPELRRILGQLGQAKWLTESALFNNKTHSQTKINVVNEIVEAVKYFSKVKCGALMVLQKSKNENLYSEVGTVLNADISSELLLTLFFPNTPLHDGAVVLCEDKVLAAGVLLPLTDDPKLSWRYGTRHRAAIGESERSDSACIVVSEETGDVSIAIDGILKKYEDIVKFREDLENILEYKKNIADENDNNINSFLFNLIKIRKK
ncbi:diadenylate cyclase CdaA [bacterium]|nr:diadenylate cyclase CdaA [bacterium]